LDKVEETRAKRAELKAQMPEDVEDPIANPPESVFDSYNFAEMFRSDLNKVGLFIFFLAIVMNRDYRNVV